MTDDSLRIFLAESAPEKEPFVQLVSDVYGRVYETKPRAAAAYAAAARGNRPVACFGIEYAGPDGFDIERLYGFERDTLQFRITNENTVQFGRLVSLEPELTPLIIYAIGWYALQKGYRFGLLEHSASIHRLILHYIPLHDIPGARLRAHLSSEEDRAYYAQKSPLPYLVSLTEALPAVFRKIPLPLRKFAPV